MRYSRLLPTCSGTLKDYVLTAPLVPCAPEVPLTRTAFVAAHIVSPDQLVSGFHWEMEIMKFGEFLTGEGRSKVDIMGFDDR